MSRRTSKTLILATVLVPLLGAPTVAVAIDDQTLGHVKHIVECTKWLFTDKTLYERYCTPSRVTQAQIDDLINSTARIDATSPATSSYTPPSSSEMSSRYDPSSSSLPSTSGPQPS